MEQTQTVAEGSARARWARIIDEHRCSGLPLAAFCRERSLAISSYYGWRAKLNREKRPTGFVEARVVEACGDDPGERTSIRRGAGFAAVDSAVVRIELAGGRRVVVTRGFDRRLLLEVIGALEEATPLVGAAS